MTPTATRSSTTTPDSVCADAVDLARAAAVEEAGETVVGEHLGVESDDERVVTHFFQCLDPGYVGWRWAVTVTRLSRMKQVTIDEVVLLPGQDAVLAPPWVPWQERLRPGDLGVGDILPSTADDDRLVPAYAAGDDPEFEDVALELGLGRVRVLSPIGRDDAVDRWYAGDRGPDAPIAKAAPARCGTCGFWIPFAGAFRGFFGVCANEYAPDDSFVVSADHGCGAHSEALVLSDAPVATATGPVDEDYELIAVDAAGAVTADDEPDEAPGEELGHS